MPDRQGNIYILGSFTGTVVAGNTTLTSSLFYPDVFVAKMDATGNFLWATRTGGMSRDYPGGLGVDASGNPVVGMFFMDQVTFGSTTLTASIHPLFGAFAVGKLNSADGTWRWATRFNYGFWPNPKMGVTAAPNGDVLITGYLPTSNTQTTAYFGTISFPSMGGGDGYITRLDGNSGAFQWAVAAGGSGIDAGTAVACDANGNAYVTGRFSGTGTFGSYTLTSAGESDVYVAKLSPTGQWLWAVRGGGTSDDFGQGLALDGSGNTYVTGSFRNVATFGSHSVGQGTGANNFLFVAKFDDSGQCQWVANAGGGSSSGRNVVLDATGQVYVAGNGNSASMTLGAAPISGNGDTYVARLNPAGSWQWAVFGGGQNGTQDVGLAQDATGSAYVTGNFVTTATFGSTTLTQTSPYGAYVAKLSNQVLAARANAHASEVMAWPQPARAGQMLNLPVSGSAALTLYDAQGRQVFTTFVPVGAAQVLLPATLTSGLYQLRLQDKMGRRQGRLLLE